MQLMCAHGERCAVADSHTFAKMAHKIRRQCSHTPRARVARDSFIHNYTLSEMNMNENEERPMSRSLFYLVSFHIFVRRCRCVSVSCVVLADESHRRNTIGAEWRWIKNRWNFAEITTIIALRFECQMRLCALNGLFQCMRYEMNFKILSYFANRSVAINWTNARYTLATTQTRGNVQRFF